MKISQLIKELEAAQKALGDVELYAEDDDGRCTRAAKVSPSIRYRKIRKGHSAGKRYFISLV